MLVLPHVHCKPHRRVLAVSPGDAMAHVRGQMHVVTRAEAARRCLSFDEEPGRASEHHNPFVPVLVVPAWRSFCWRVRDC